VVTTTTMDRIADTATEQWGLITRRQAEAAGVPDTTLERLTAPGGLLTRVAFGVYLLSAAPTPDHVDLRAAWLQLEPAVPAWARTVEQGVVSHRSAASLYEIGHLPADTHEFTVPSRRQTRRADMKIHVRRLDQTDVLTRQGLPLTRPARIASDLAHDREDPEAIAQIVVDATRGGLEYPGTFATALAPHARRFGQPAGDGLAALNWLLDLAAPAADTARWTAEARGSLTEQNEPRERSTR
jgi:Transcriptional regulator, AbiEi antitoxin